MLHCQKRARIYLLGLLITIFLISPSGADTENWNRNWAHYSDEQTITYSKNLQPFQYLPNIMIFDRIKGLVSWGKTAESDDLKQQQENTRSLLRKIQETDDDDLDAIEVLYLQIIEESPSTEIAEEIYWRLSNMYIQVYYPARDTDAIRILEEYLNRYPDSDYLDRRFSLFSNGLPVVKNRLVSLYSKEGEHEKMIRLFEEEIPDISNTPDSLVDYLLDYARSLEKVGRREEAITVYQMYILHEKGEMKDHARRNIIELGGELLESDTSGMVKEAARIGDISELDRLLKTGITPDTELLHIAVRSSQIPTVRYLLEEGIDPDGGIICWTQQSFRSLGSTPLYLAVQEKQPDMVQLLLDYGANSSLYGEGASSRLLIPLELAIESREYEIMEILLYNGAECYSRFFPPLLRIKMLKLSAYCYHTIRTCPKD